MIQINLAVIIAFVLLLISSLMVNFAFVFICIKGKRKIKQYAFVKGDVILTLDNDDYIEIAYKELKCHLDSLVERCKR